MKKSRKGFTLVELLVVIAILAVLVAFLLPAIQQAREAANRSSCTNNARQVALALQNHNSELRSLPLMKVPVGTATPQNSQYWTFKLLPYIEEKVLYDLGGGATGDPVVTNNAYQTTVRPFLCPSDKTGTGGERANTAANYNTIPVTGPKLSIPADFPDGTSKTILTGERLQTCGTAGNKWNPRESDAALGYEPMFDETGLFQSAPSAAACNSLYASSAHAGGMNVGMADGSVRFLANDINNAVWQAIMTPKAGDAIPGDF